MASKIAACIIAYNVEDKIKDLIQSLVGQVDYLVVGIDAKTTDNTKQSVLSFKDAGFQEIVLFKFVMERDGAVDFASARNMSFAQAPADTDWLLWIDTDDVLVGDLRSLAASQDDNISMVWMPYQYFRDQYGNVTTTFIRERLLRKKFRPLWKGRLHETCEVDPGGKWSKDTVDVFVDHKNRADEGKGERNFSALLKMIDEDPENHRAVLYMGHQHFAVNNWREAAEWYNKFAGLRSPGDVTEEKWQARIMAAKALRNAGDFNASINSATQALLMCPQYPDAYFELSATYRAHNDFDKCAHWFEEGMARNIAGEELHRKPHAILIQNPLDYSYNPFVVVHGAYYRLGRVTEALACLDQALQFRPDEPSLKQAKAVYLWRQTRNEAVKTQVEIAEYLASSNEPLKALEVLDNLPSGTSEEFAGVSEAKHKIQSLVSHLYDDTEYENFYVQRPDEIKADELLAKNHSYPRMEWAINQVLKMGAKRVLDVGSGNGLLALHLAKRGVQVVGMDIDPRRVKEANWAAVRAGLLSAIRRKMDTKKSKFRPRLPDILPSSRVQFHYGKAEDIPDKVKNLGPFDAIICTEVLEHVAEPLAVVKQLEQFKVPVVITTPDGASPFLPHPGHVRAWSRAELEQLFWPRGQILECHFLADMEDCLGLSYVPGVNVQDRTPVVIYCGKGWEAWGPDQIDKIGLGGSETAVVKVSRELVKKGARVMVYGEAEGIWDGAIYRHWTKWNPQSAVWLTIAWRHPELFDLPMASQMKWLWMHDTDAGPNITEERMKRVDTILCLSEWHRQHLEQMYPFAKDKLFNIGNGIDADRFAQPELEKRNLNRIVYASSPERGLDRALAFFTEIRKEIPEAEFHVYYGWTNYDLMNGNQGYKSKIKRMANQPGVVWHERIGQAQLAREFMQSGILLYPSHEFNETFCISALEAQAGGCVPVTRDNGALPETNRYGALLSNTEATITDYISAIKDAQAIPDAQRQEMIAWAQQQTWAKVADRMAERMKAVFSEVTVEEVETFSEDRRDEVEDWVKRRDGIKRHLQEKEAATA